MKFSKPLRFSSKRFISSFLSAWCFLALAAAPLLAVDAYLAPNHPDGISLLSGPPMADSPEQSIDLASARSVFNGRSPQEEKRANELAHLNIFVFTPAIGSFFQAEKYPKTTAFFANLKPHIKPAIDTPKNFWRRKRPYEIDSHLCLGKPEASFGYPSGHSTIGTVHALLLAELFPDKRDAILAVGRDIGWSRVIIGKHFPTDIYAGRVLGQAIVRELMASPGFQKDFAEVKAEVQSVQRN